MQAEQGQQLQAVGGFLQVGESGGRAGGSISGGVGHGHIVHLLAGDLRAVPRGGQGGEGRDSALGLQGGGKGPGIESEPVGGEETSGLLRVFVKLIEAKAGRSNIFRQDGLREHAGELRIESQELSNGHFAEAFRPLAGAAAAEAVGASAPAFASAAPAASSPESF